MRMRVLAVTLLTGCAGATAAVSADLGENTTIGGRVFFDVSHIRLQNENTPGSKLDTPPTGTGFDVKRFYLIVDHRFNDVWSANLTTDAQFTTASTAIVSTSTGTTTALTNQNSSGGVSEVFIKKLYLEGKFDNLLVVHAGSYDMPWDPFAESLYAYRYVEKTITDRLGYSNTTDWGLNASGTGGTNGMFSYAASVVNGGGFKNPTRTKGVDFEARVSAKRPGWTNSLAPRWQPREAATGRDRTPFFLRRRNGSTTRDEPAIAKLLSLSRRPVINLPESLRRRPAGRTAFLKATEGKT